MKQEIGYTNPKAGKLYMTTGTVSRVVSYLTGIAAVTGLVIGTLEKDVELLTDSTSYVEAFLRDLRDNRDSIFAASVGFNLGGGLFYGLGKWKHWRKNE